MVHDGPLLFCRRLHDPEWTANHCAICGHEKSDHELGACYVHSPTNPHVCRTGCMGFIAITDVTLGA